MRSFNISLVLESGSEENSDYDHKGHSKVQKHAVRF